MTMIERRGDRVAVVLDMSCNIGGALGSRVVRTPTVMRLATRVPRSG